MTRDKQPKSEPGSEAAEPSPADAERQFLRKVRRNMDDAADDLEGPAAAVERANKAPEPSKPQRR